MSGDEYKEQILGGRYIAERYLAPFLEAKKAEIGDAYHYKALEQGGQWALWVKRFLTKDEITELQDKTTPQAGPIWG